MQNAAAQNFASDSLRAKFNKFRSQNFTEKVFLHTDRSSYFTGEDIWFAIYHVDASLHQPVDWSKVLYVELIGSDGKPLVQRKFPLGDTTTTGSLYLPASLSSGNYELIAYTSWMKNFGSESFFRQTISVINPFIELPKEADQGPEYDIQFFPEGGNLVYGLENTIAFRAVGRDGTGINFKGSILNQQNDTLVRFSPLKFGLGRFNFRPERDQVYRIIVVDQKRKSFVYSLPAISQEGYVMRTEELLTKIRVLVRTSDKTQKPVYLLLHTRQTRLQIEQAIVKDGEAIFMIDKKALADGVSHLTIFNEALDPVCERLWFKKPEKLLHFDIKLNQEVLSTRKDAELTVRAYTDNALAKLSNISVVVCKSDSLGLPADNIVSYMNLTSELKGNVEHAEYYFSESSQASEAANNLMLVQGWRKVNWKNVMTQNSSLKYLPELNGHIISGTLTDGATGKPVNRVAVYLTLTGMPVDVYISRSDSLGRFLFETQPGVGKRNLIVQPDGRVNNGYQVELDDPFFSQVAQHKLKLSLSKGLQSAIEQRSIHMQVNSLFHPVTSLGKPVKDRVPFYGKADEHYLLDDYTRFPTLEEVFREYVPGVRVSKSRGHFQLNNLNMINKEPFRQTPLVLIDGVPVFDMDVLMNVDPLKIKELEVIKRRYYLQVASFDGVVSLTSYKNDLGGFQPPADVLLTSYSCFEEHREFFTPIYQTEKQIVASTPDVRYLLYRSPDRLASSGNDLTLNFYTSDIAGQFTVVIQGITTDGLPGYSTTTFEVK